jgi:hypothetical protein
MRLPGDHSFGDSLVAFGIVHLHRHTQRFPQKLLDIYTWRFSFPDTPGAEVTAPQGQTVTWSVPEGEHAGQYRVRNVKAVFWNHAEYNYWIARK